MIIAVSCYVRRTIELGQRTLSMTKIGGRYITYIYVTSMMTHTNYIAMEDEPYEIEIKKTRNERLWSVFELLKQNYLLCSKDTFSYFICIYLSCKNGEHVCCSSYESKLSLDP